MRRVYDDTMYLTAQHDILRALQSVNPSEIDKYSYGVRRANAKLIREYVLKVLNHDRPMYAFGRVDHAYNIGNNNAAEIIWLGNPDEQQVCGLFHCNEDMHYSAYCYTTDIDGNRKSSVRKISGRG